MGSSGQEPAARKVGVRWDVCTSLVFTSCVTVGGTVLWMPGPSLVAQGGADSVRQAWEWLVMSWNMSALVQSCHSRTCDCIFCRETPSHPAPEPLQWPRQEPYKILWRCCSVCVLTCGLSYQQSPSEQRTWISPLWRSGGIGWMVLRCLLISAPSLHTFLTGLHWLRWNLAAKPMHLGNQKPLWAFDCVHSLTVWNESHYTIGAALYSHFTP